MTTRAPRRRSDAASKPATTNDPIATPPDAPGAEVFADVVTGDPGMRRVFRIVEKAAQSEASVLLRGETGTGKELLARALHQLSPRRRGPFHAISCAALPASLLESELFGHVRGAFTGAVRDSPGHFRLADTGSLFLDEVAEMPLEVQAKLLRVLETHTVVPVGGSEPIRVDVRIIAATHRALRADVEAGLFRADLMYRLRVVPIFIPPLRERPGDVLLLAERFIHELNQRAPRRIESISPAAAAVLVGHDWPGNVRELRNVIEYAFVVGETAVIEVADLPPELSGQRPGAPPPRARRSEHVLDGRPRSPRAADPEAEAAEGAERVRQALERAGGHTGDAAELLGISRVTLWRRMARLGLSRPRSARASKRDSGR